MTNLTKKEQQTIRKFKKEADAILTRMAKDRDALRDLITDYEYILEELDNGIVDFENALDAISGNI
jgi:hypothetical protein